VIFDVSIASTAGQSYTKIYETQASL